MLDVLYFHIYADIDDVLYYQSSTIISLIINTYCQKISNHYLANLSQCIVLLDFALLNFRLHCRVKCWFSFGSLDGKLKTKN